MGGQAPEGLYHQAIILVKMNLVNHRGSVLCVKVKDLISADVFQLLVVGSLVPSSPGFVYLVLRGL